MDNPSTTAAPNRLLTTNEAAELLNVRPQTLALWRSAKRYDLPYIRVGNSVRYRLGDIERWLAENTENR